MSALPRIILIKFFIVISSAQAFFRKNSYVPATRPRLVFVSVFGTMLHVVLLGTHPSGSSASFFTGMAAKSEDSTFDEIRREMYVSDAPSLHCPNFSRHER